MKVPSDISELSFIEAIIKMISLDLGYGSFESQSVNTGDKLRREFLFLAYGKRITLHVNIYASRRTNIASWNLFEGDGVEGRCFFTSGRISSRIASENLALDDQPMSKSKRDYSDGSKMAAELEVQWARELAGDLSEAILLYCKESPNPPISKKKQAATVKKSNVYSSISEILDSVEEDDVVFPEPARKVAYRTALEPVIPDKVLDFFQLENSDKSAVSVTVEKLVSEAWVTWDNHESVIRSLKWKSEEIAREYWEAKYPDFDDVEMAYTRAERDLLWPMLLSWYAVAACVLFIQIPFVQAVSPFALLTALLLTAVRKISYKPAFYPYRLMDAKHRFIEDLTAEWEKKIERLVKQRVKKAFGLTAKDWLDSVNGLWQPLGPRPVEPKHELTPKEAEEFVAQYLRFLGIEGAKTTRYSRDGGVDVVGERLVAQVKHQKNPVGVTVVREIYGVATSEGKIGAVFAKSGFTKEAVEFSSRSGVLLLTYNRSLRAHNKLSESILMGGWPELQREVGG